MDQLVETLVQLDTELEQCLDAGKSKVTCGAMVTGEVALALVIYSLDGASPPKGKQGLVRSIVAGLFATRGGELRYIDSFEGMALELAQSALLQITTQNLPDGTVGTPYDQPVEVSGGSSPYSWAVTSGALPDGLGLGAETGGISGTPTTAGTSTFDVTVTDKNGQDDKATFTLSVANGVTTNPPDAVANVPYSTTLPGVGTPPYTWQMTSGSLPENLTLASATGVISGTPPVAACFTGAALCTTVTSAFTVEVTDSQGQTASMAAQIRVQPSPMCTADCSLQVTIGVAQGLPALVVTAPAQAPCGAVPVQCESILFVRSPDGFVRGAGQFGWIGPNWLRDISGTNYVTRSTCSPGQSEWAALATWDGIVGHPYRLVAASNVVQC